jgi:hypothetical protein
MAIGRVFFCSLFLLAGSFPAMADDPTGGGGPVAMPRDDLSSQMTEIQLQVARNIKKLGLEPIDVSRSTAVQSLIDRTNLERLIFPLQLAPASKNITGHGVSNFVDLSNAGPGDLMEYTCGRRTYDLASGYDHQGIDMFTTPFSWARMNANEQNIIAAAGGVIVARVDGQFDRNCSFNPSNTQANYVAVRHDDGLVAFYLHMKRNSLTAKTIGDRVEVGEYLGQVGSSGISTGPHLHFELQDASGLVVDPNAGTCGSDTTLWKQQPKYREPLVTRVGIHDQAPQYSFDSCVEGTAHYGDLIALGGPVSISANLKDQPVGVPATISLIKPDGTVLSQGTTGSPNVSQGSFNAAVWFFNFTIPSAGPTGAWKGRVEFAGRTYEQSFWVGNAKPSSTALVASVLPSSRSVKSGTTATIFATALNFGAETAYGCNIAADTPLGGAFTFQTTDPATNALTGIANQSVDIAAGQGQSFLIAVAVDAGEVAKSYNVPLRVKCANSDAVTRIDGVNTFLLSFEPGDVADVIALAATASNDGVLAIPGAGSAGAFSLATANVGSAASLTIRPRTTSGGDMPLSICATNATTGACLADPTSGLTRTFGADETATFAVFVTANDAVPFDPAGSRVFVDIVDAAGVSRGSTSIAVRTDG